MMIKCRMCGGTLNPVGVNNIAECEFCGSRQTIPSLDDERKEKLYERANPLLFACDFTKAEGAYDAIINEFPADADSYWGLLLCKYGVEYIDDPLTGKKVPTCHRVSFDSILEDPDFEMVMENSEGEARELYRRQAKVLEGLRRDILEISGKEEPYDIFICYKETDDKGDRTVDSVLAQEVYDALSGKGYRVFFSRVSLEDKLGVNYEPYIFAALQSAKLMLAFGTSYNNYNAVWVKNEWSRFVKLMAGDKSKHLIACYKGIDAYDIPKEFAHLQGQDMGKPGAVQDLLRGVDKLLRQESIYDAPQAAGQNVSSAGYSGPTDETLKKRLVISLEDGDWAKARQIADDILNRNPESAEGYLGMYMADIKVPDRKMLEEHYIKNGPAGKSISRFAQYADEADRVWMRGLEEKRQAETERIKQEKALQARKERLEMEELARDTERLAGIRRKWNKARPLIAYEKAFEHDALAAVCTDGTVLTNGLNVHQTEEVSKWRRITAVCFNIRILAGVQNDGKVAGIATEGGYGLNLAADGGWLSEQRKQELLDSGSQTEEYVLEPKDESELVVKADGRLYRNSQKSRYAGPLSQERWNGHFPEQQWKGIVSSVCIGSVAAALKEDGTVVVDYIKPDGKERAEYILSRLKQDKETWSNLVYLSPGPEERLVGLKADGNMAAMYTNPASCSEKGISEENPFREWKLFNSIDTFEEERKTAVLNVRKDIERQNGINQLKNRKAELVEQLKNLKGLFNGKQRKELEAQIEAVDAECLEKYNTYIDIL
ncbi:MAG: toll/interleukin-1 receptor domain-containing protein [Eubacterium sp.]|nr:toll/interleukin-1 receptor domain-containing protein [Eubacterium sp.]